MSATNLEYWRLKTVEGRQTWHYLECEIARKQWPQTDLDRYWLGILDEIQILDQTKPITAYNAAYAGLNFLCKLQTSDGILN